MACVTWSMRLLKAHFATLNMSLLSKPEGSQEVMIR